MLFFSVSVLTYVFSLSDYIQSKKYKQPFFFCLVALLVAFSGFRGLSWASFYSWDTNHYVGFFNDLKPFESPAGSDFGYYIINSLVKLVIDNYRVLLLLMSFITLSLVAKSITRYTNRWFFALLAYVSLFYYVRDFGQIRASLAYALVLFGLRYVHEQRFLKYLFIIAIATTIHASAILGLGIYFFPRIKFKNWHLYGLLFFSLALYFISTTGLWLTVIDILGEGFFLGRMNAYLVTASKSISLDVKRLFYYAFAFAGVFFRKRLLKTDEFFDTKLYSVIFGLILTAMLREIEVLAVRIPEIYLTMLIFVIPAIAQVSRNKFLQAFSHHVITFVLLIYNIAMLFSLQGLVY